MSESEYLENMDQVGRYLANRMSAQVDSLLDTQGLEPNRGLPKTYVLEADTQFSSVGRAVEQLQAVLGDSFSVVQTDTKVIRILGRQPLSPSAHGRPVLFLNADHYRIWHLMTDAPSAQADRVWERITKSISWLDKTWLPSQTLQGFSDGFGFVTGATSRFAQRFTEVSDERRPWLSIKLWGTNAPQALSTLSDSRLSDTFSLTALRLRYFGSSSESAHDDITFDGKVTSWGRSWDAHQELLERIFLSTYLEELILPLEETFQLLADDEGVVKGQSALIRFSNQIENVAEFVHYLLSSQTSFRLVGIVDTISETFARILAVDQHIGQPVTIEVEQGFMRVSLREGTCGNTLLRLLSLIQQEFDPSARLTDSRGVDILS